MALASGNHLWSQGKEGEASEATHTQLEQRNALLHTIKPFNMCCATLPGWSPTTSLGPTTPWVSCLATCPPTSLAGLVPKRSTNEMYPKIGRFRDGLQQRSTTEIAKVLLVGPGASSAAKELPKFDPRIRAHSTDTSALLLSTEVLDPKARRLLFLFSSKKGFQSRVSSSCCKVAVQSPAGSGAGRCRLKVAVQSSAAPRPQKSCCCKVAVQAVVVAR